MKKLFLVTILTFSIVNCARAEISTGTVVNDKTNIETKDSKRTTQERLKRLEREGKLKLCPSLAGFYYNPKDSKQLKILEKYLKHKDADYRLAAANLLSSGDERAITILRSALNDKDEKVQVKVAWALCRLGDKITGLPGITKEARKGNIDILFYDENRKRKCFDDVLGKSVLIELTKNEDEEIRSKAAFYLATYFGEKESLELKIEEMLKSNNPRVKEIGESLLQQKGDKKSKKRLQELEYQEIQEEIKKAEQINSQER
ncbi:MAG: HEAT repeat domain-containing protein [Elusimicrobiota bacterium]